jgi:hypothetical protein
MLLIVLAEPGFWGALVLTLIAAGGFVLYG